MDGSQDGVLLLVQRLCGSLLTHTPVQANRSNDGYTPAFQVPHHLSRGWDKKRKLALRHLTRTAFDLILLRKWAWFGVWGSELTPECRCLSHTYDMHLQGFHREAARLENAVSTLMGEDNPLQEKESILKFLVLMVSGRHQKQVPSGLDAPQLPGVCYECYPSSLFEQLPAVEQVCELNTAMSESAELFECVPGSGFTGFFSSESLGKDKGPSASSLFDGLTHATLADLNTALGLPSLPSQPDTISLLNNSSKDSGIADSPVRGGGRCVWAGDTGEGEEEWIDPSLLSVLTGEGGGTMLVRAWEGWEESKSYLSEGGEETFTHASTLCVARLAPLAGITLPMDMDAHASPRHMVAALDALPTSLLHPTPVQSDSISQAFSRMLSSLLVYCRAQLHDATDGKSDIFAQAAVNNLLPLVRFLLQLLSNTTNCPKGLQLLDVLYAQASRVQGTPHYPFLLSLLKKTAVPYLQFVWQWVFQGWLGTDEEFGLHADQDSLTRRDHRYWVNGYRLSSPCTPHFLTEHTHTILTCGKALNLLRMCCPTHPLCGRTIKPPRVALVVCVEDLQEISHQCQAYISEVTEHIKRSEQQLREEELSREHEVHEVAARLRRDARDAADKIRCMERAYVEEQREKKQALYQELTQQMRKAQALRVEREVEIRQRDREMVAALSLREEALSAEERRLQQEAREELVAYYEELSLEAEKRRMRAEWQGRRLELSQERQWFLQQEREELEREEREREVETESGAPVESQRTREAVHTTQQQGRTEELGEQVVRSEEDEGDGERRGGGEGGRPRRTWAESVATPVGHQGRKTWVASLIEAPITPVIDAPITPDFDAPITPVIPASITPVVDDHPNNVSASPSSIEHRTQCQFGPGASTQTSVALCNEGNTVEEFSKDLTPKVSSTMEQLPPSVAQAVDMESRQESGMEPRETTSMEPGQEAHVTPAKAREQPSIAQDIIYGHKIVSPEQLERIQSQERATHTTPREDSSRGWDPPSTAQDIIYARGTTAQLIEDAMSPRLVSTRGQAPPSTAQDVMYGQGGVNLVAQSTRGQAPPSIVQDIMYARSPTPVGFTSTRGKPPPVSIQRLLYPVKDKEEEGRSVKMSQKVKREEEQRFPTFQPYQDSYPMLSLPPTHDILDGLLGPASSPPHTTDTAFLSLYPLPALVDHSITLPILTQSGLVNSALVDHFLRECHIMRHFVALKRYLLMEDGEFGHSLASRLFDELTFGHNWRHLCSASFLNPLLSTALSGSLHGRSPEAERLSFALKYQPSAVKTHSVDALEFLELRYKVDWPCNIVITGDTISRYNRVFQLLLQLKRASWTLKSIFAHLKKTDGLDEWQLRQLQIYRHEFQHFITVMQGYITNQLFHLSWGEFETELNQHVHSLDDLIQAHKNFIDKTIFRCLLSKKARPVMNIIHGILTSVLKFGEQLILSASPPQRRYQAMCDTHIRDFRKAATLLITVVTKLVQRGYQPHLEDLLLRLNFNGLERAYVEEQREKKQALYQELAQQIQRARK